MPNFFTINRPTLLLNEHICRENIAFMCDRAEEANLRFRPHMKTAQSRYIAAFFREKGVNNITVSSVGMARYFADDGWDDITIAFPFNIREAASLNDFRNSVHLNILLEAPDTVNLLDDVLCREIDVWIKLDTGLGRTGIVYDDTNALDELVCAVHRSRRMHLRGLLTHAGMTYSAKTTDEIVALFETSRQRLVEVSRRYDEMECSAGDTPGCTLARNFSGLNEIRPGNMTFYDLMQVRLGVCGMRNIAVAAACPVVSVHQRRGTVVLYGGAIHLSKESIPDENGHPVYGQICELSSEGWSEPVEGAVVIGMSQEHGIARLPAPLLRRIRPGDMLAVLPVHSCLTADAFGAYLTLDGAKPDHYSAHKNIL